MKFRFALGLTALFAAVLVFGLGAMPTRAHAATPVTLSTAEQSSLQAVLDVTEAALDAMQAQIDHNEVRNPAAMLSTLSGVRGYLLNMQSLLAGEPVAATPVATAPQPGSQVAGASTAPAPGSGTGQQPAGDAMAVDDEPDAAEPDSAPAFVEDEPAMDGQAALVGSNVASRWVFWLILIVAVVLAVVLAVPRRRTSTATVMSGEPERSEQPQLPKQQTPKQTPPPKSQDQA